MKFSQWLVEHESTTAKTGLYPLGYGGIGLYPASYMMTQGPDAFYYMSVDERFLELLDGVPHDITHIPGEPSHYDTTPGEGPPWDITKIKEVHLHEMPISKFELQGKWDQKSPKYGYNKQDIGILTNQRAVDKIHRKWSNTKQNFDFYFLRSREGAKHIEVGEVTPEWVRENLAVNIQPNPDAITIIFTNNRGTEKIPMTAWAIAHRMGHAVRRLDHWQRYVSDQITRDFKEILEYVYGYERTYGRNDEPQLRALAYAVGSMRSARTRSLLNFYEFPYELLAQYITTGKIRFNPLPKFLILKNKMAWGRPAPETRSAKVHSDDLAEWSEILQGHAKTYEYYLDEVFNGLDGRIFVM